MRKIPSFILKHKLIWFIIILCFSFHMHKSYSQNPSDKFTNQNCEYIQFINDTLIDFMLYGGHQGSLATMYHGMGKYRIGNDQLTVVVGEYKIGSLIKNRDTDLSCPDFKEKISGIDKYHIEILSDETIKLTGPIIDGYQKLNRQRFLKSFLNWPWKWSFKKQHWYDPRERELYISKT